MGRQEREENVVQSGVVGRRIQIAQFISKFFIKENTLIIKRPPMNEHYYVINY